MKPCNKNNDGVVPSGPSSSSLGVSSKLSSIGFSSQSSTTGIYSKQSSFGLSVHQVKAELTRIHFPELHYWHLLETELIWSLCPPGESCAP
jgi:hypothetical protein